METKLLEAYGTFIRVCHLINKAERSQIFLMGFIKETLKQRCEELDSIGAVLETIRLAENKETYKAKLNEINQMLTNIERMYQ